MQQNTIRFRHSVIDRFVSVFLSISFLATYVIPPHLSHAQSYSPVNMPVPGAMVFQTPGFAPAIIRGVEIDPANPLNFKFIIDAGESSLEGKALEEESLRLVKYFLASLTVPEEEMWVNLSPYEQDRIIPEPFGRTAMGADLLAEDYLLKQLTASLMYPEEDLGKTFWDRVRARTRAQFGDVDVPVDSFHKVWIVPRDAEVIQKGGLAVIAHSSLEVMLEEDYFALQEAQNNQTTDHRPQTTENKLTELQTEVMREIIIPAIEKEVNEGAHFARLRQIYNAMILAAWYKITLKENLLGRIYVDRNKVAGVDTDDPRINQAIYDQYIEAFRKGVYDYIREDEDPVTGEIIPRQYFSGGFDPKGSDGAMLSDRVRLSLTLLDDGDIEAAAQKRAVLLRAAKGPFFELGIHLIEDPKGAAEMAARQWETAPLGQGGGEMAAALDDLLRAQGSDVQAAYLVTAVSLMARITGKASAQELFVYLKGLNTKEINGIRARLKTEGLAADFKWNAALNLLKIFSDEEMKEEILEDRGIYDEGGEGFAALKAYQEIEQDEQRRQAEKNQALFQALQQFSETAKRGGEPQQIGEILEPFAQILEVLKDEDARGESADPAMLALTREEFKGMVRDGVDSDSYYNLYRQAQDLRTAIMTDERSLSRLHLGHKIGISLLAEDVERAEGFQYRILKSQARLREIWQDLLSVLDTGNPAAHDMRAWLAEAAGSSFLPGTDAVVPEVFSESLHDGADAYYIYDLYLQTAALSRVIRMMGNRLREVLNFSGMWFVNLGEIQPLKQGLAEARRRKQDLLAEIGKSFKQGETAAQGAVREADAAFVPPMSREIVRSFGEMMMNSGRRVTGNIFRGTLVSVIPSANQRRGDSAMLVLNDREGYPSDERTRQRNERILFLHFENTQMAQALRRWQRERQEIIDSNHTDHAEEVRVLDEKIRMMRILMSMNTTALSLLYQQTASQFLGDGFGRAAALAFEGVENWQEGYEASREPLPMASQEAADDGAMLANVTVNGRVFQGIDQLRDNSLIRFAGSEGMIRILFQEGGGFSVLVRSPAKRTEHNIFVPGQELLNFLEQADQTLSEEGGLWIFEQMLVRFERGQRTRVSDADSEWEEGGISSVGGIDFNSAYLDLKIRRDSAGIPLPVSEQPLQELMDIPGFAPVIMNITPIQSLPMLLGLNKS